MKRILGLALALCAFAASAATLAPIQLLNPAGSSSGQTIVSTGASTAPAWGAVPLTGLSPIAANTVLANFGASSATPSAFAIPTCNSSTSALQYTAGTGVVCGTVAAAGVNANITSLTGLTTPLATSAGGLGANNSAANGVPVFSSGAVTVTATTGSGNAVLQNSPTINTPNIQGVTNGGAATSGQVGQSLVASGSSVSIANSTPTDCASLSLPAGDWDVWGNVNFAPAGGAQLTVVSSGFSTTSATLPTVPNLSQTVYAGSNAFGQSSMPPMQMENLSSSTTVYLVGNVGFSSGTVTMTCFINARRVH